MNINTVYIDTLIENCQQAKTSKPIKEFIFSNLEQLNGIKQAIYIIEEVNGDKDKTFNDFTTYKNTKKRKCSKPNQPSSTMYVGSSTTGIKKRIEQHLGNGHKSTYALHLKYWFMGEYKITIFVYDEPIEILQIIEDNISYNLKPAFGKMGGNNK